MQGISEEIDRLGAHIHAAENWSEDYLKTPEIHAKLLKTESRLQRALRKFFYDLSQNTKLIHWNRYRELQADYRIDVLINNEELDASDGTFIKVVLGDITEATALGAAAGDALYPIKLGLSSSDEVIQRIALDRSAELVGKTVLPDGSIVDNVLGGLDITEATRANIRQSIKTSIALGENVQEAKARLQSVIKNPKRAQLISRTEVVNSFGQGLTEYGKQTGAVGKQWRDTGAQDICAENTSAGPIRFDEQFPSGDYQPTAHPNCRCSIRLIYKNELDANPNLFDGGDLSGDPGWWSMSYEDRLDDVARTYQAPDLFRNPDAPRKVNDTLIGHLAEKSGYTGRPTIASAEELDAIAAKGSTIYYRGVKDTMVGKDWNREGTLLTAKDIRTQFRTGDYYVGQGVHGSGTYVTKSDYAARMYSTDEKVLRMAYDPSAKIISEADLEARMVAEYNRLKVELKTASIEESKVIKNKMRLVEDQGSFAMLNGYDVITVPSVKENATTIIVNPITKQPVSIDLQADVVLNRTKLIVQATDYEVKT